MVTNEATGTTKPLKILQLWITLYSDPHGPCHAIEKYSPDSSPAYEHFKLLISVL